MSDGAADRRLKLRYLQGELSADERSAFEERYATDDALFEELLGAESDSYDAYARGELEGAAKLAFERRFLATPEQRRRLDFARALLRRTNPGTPQRRAWATRPVLGLGLAAGVLAAATGALLLANARLRRELTELRAERVASQQRADSLAPQRVMPSQEPPGVGIHGDGTRAPTSDPAQVEVASLRLTTDQLRNAGEQRTLLLREGIAFARLEAVVEGPTYSTCKAWLETPDGATVWHDEELRGRSLGAGAWVVALRVPAQSLPSGDFVLRLSGRLPDATLENVGAYSFRVLR